jgi:hypothetical protein
MSGSSVSAYINIYSESDASRAIMLPDGRSIGGILERAEPVGSGLIRVSVSCMNYLVDESLQEDLAELIGQQVTICRVFGHWGAGAIPA